MRRRGLPVALVVAATLVTVTTILLVAYGTWSYRSASKREYRRLQRVIEAHVDELAVGLALPVWNIDRPQIDRIIEGLGQTDQMYGVVVKAAGKTHARVRNERGEWVLSETGRFPVGEDFPAEERNIKLFGEKIGTVQLFGTPRVADAKLREQLLTMVGAILLIELLLIATVYWILYRAVLRPLTAIERYAVAVSGGARPATTERGFTAEMESLGDSIETMVHLLDERYSELHEQMEERQQSEERFRTIFDSANDSIFIYDEVRERAVVANIRCCEMFGYSQEEFLALPRGSLSSGIWPYTYENIAARIRRGLDGPIELFEWQLKRSNGQLFWAEISARGTTLHGERMTILVTRDITQRKEMEQALRRSERMSAMGALVGGVAHEVRNPLFGISAILDAFKEELRHPELVELDSGLRQQVSRLTHLMTELLEFGRPVAVNLTAGSLHDLVAEVVVSRSRAAGEAGVLLRSTVDRSLPPLRMDWSRMRQVFENLVDNALQHAPEVRTVTISAESIVQEGRGWIECRVTDDGTGFRVEDIPRLFEPFFTRRAGGTGLGLPIVQRIVEEHSGRVNASNGAGGGAIITMRLPQSL